MVPVITQHIFIKLHDQNSLSVSQDLIISRAEVKNDALQGRGDPSTKKKLEESK